MSSNGELISELGAKRYLYGRGAQGSSNIKFFDRGETLKKNWDKCNFGCHGPSYRTLQRPSTWGETLKSLDDINPLLAGVVDGLHHQSIYQAQIVGAGIERTAEGLHLLGEEKFDLVATENMATVSLIESTYQRIIEFDLDLIDNPLMQAIIVIVNDYIAAIPEWVIEEMLKQGALIFPNGVDRQVVIRAVRFAVNEALNSETVDDAVAYLGGRVQRQVGKQLGKKLAVAIAVVVACKISKKLIRDSSESWALKRRLVSLRKIAKVGKGGFGGALITLLKAQGILGRAAKASRTLKQDCPTTWHTLRYRLQGADMIYFLIQPMIQEYIDRLSLLEKNPGEFMHIMEELIKAKVTEEVFYPSFLGIKH